MKTLSSNYNGKVVRTSSVGFSPKKVVDFLVKEIALRNLDCEVVKAKTGSFYVTVNWCEIRVSNHTKRGQNYDDVLLFETYTHKQSTSIEAVNVISSALFYELKENLEKIFDLIKNN